MPEENYQKIKLLKIMEILRQEADEEPPMTKVELAARLVAMNVSCSPRSLIRDIKLLNEQGYEIMERLIGHEKGYFVCDRSFSVPELKILIDAVQAASFVTEKKTAELVDKIAALGGCRFRRRADSRFKSKLFARSALKAGVRIPAGAPRKTDGHLTVCFFAGFCVFVPKIPRTFWGKYTEQSRRIKLAEGGFESETWFDSDYLHQQKTTCRNMSFFQFASPCCK